MKPERTENMYIILQGLHCNRKPKHGGENRVSILCNMLTTFLFNLIGGCDMCSILCAFEKMCSEVVFISVAILHLLHKLTCS